MTFVDPEVTKLKLDNEIESWHASAPLYRKRGWILLERNGIEVDVGFLAQLSLGGQSVPVMTACVRPPQYRSTLPLRSWDPGIPRTSTTQRRFVVVAPRGARGEPSDGL